MKFKVLALFLGLIVAAIYARAAEPEVDTERVITVAINREQFLREQLTTFAPMVETYIQNMRDGSTEQGAVPEKDEYHLGRLYVGEGRFEESFFTKRSGASTFFKGFFGFNVMTYDPVGFAGQMMLDPSHFSRDYYTFRYVGREFLGDVRCFMFDVSPVGKKGFEGRIWVEEKEYHIARFNGIWLGAPVGKYYFHVDSWRQELRPGLWVPVVVYNEETGMNYGGVSSLRMRATTRYWGYYGGFDRKEELSRVFVDTANALKDQTPPPAMSSMDSQIAWRRQAEDNILDRLAKFGLVGAHGEAEEALERVARRILASNKIELAPQIRCRVLLTLPIESFSVGHTIVVSRGLLDTVPDEATLAFVLSREIAGMLSSDGVDTRYAFYDRTSTADEAELLKFRGKSGRPSPNLDQDAYWLLSKSPYRDQAGSAVQFIRAAAERAPTMKALFKPQIGNAWNNVATPQPGVQLGSEVSRATPPALPLGARVTVNGWYNSVQLIDTQRNSKLAAVRMPFEVTPLFLYLTSEQERVTTRWMLAAEEEPGSSKGPSQPQP